MISRKQRPPNLTSIRVWFVLERRISSDEPEKNFQSSLKQFALNLSIWTFYSCATNSQRSARSPKSINTIGSIVFELKEFHFWPPKFPDHNDGTGISVEKELVRTNLSLMFTSSQLRTLYQRSTNALALSVDFLLNRIQVLPTLTSYYFIVWNPQYTVHRWHTRASGCS